MAATKIATCCYCGARAALVLRGKTQHELSCSSCGAPLKALKMLPIQREATKPAKPVQRPQPFYSAPEKKAKRSRKSSKFKNFKRKLWEEIWDEVEDLFD